MLKIFIKTIALSFFIFISNQTVYSQEYLKIIYEKPYSRDAKKEVLYATRENAVSEIIANNTTSSNTVSVDKDNTNLVNVNISNAVLPTKYYKSIKGNKISIVDFINGKKYNIIDSIPEMTWSFNTNETKTIGKYNCSKATLSFRGTIWEAWYSSDLPISFGPWKFSGLPGAILEIYDKENKENTWIASEIVYPASESISLTPSEFENTISIKKFVALEIEEQNEVLQKIMARTSKNAAKTSAIQIQRIGPEKKYEWE